jgi:hypothetical protein
MHLTRQISRSIQTLVMDFQRLSLAVVYPEEKTTSVIPLEARTISVTRETT